MKRNLHVLSMLLAVIGPIGWRLDAALAQTRVDLELVLAVDVSLSMDLDELRLQRQGYIAAFRHADVISAIQSGGWGRIAVAYFEWAGEGSGRLTVPWTLVDGVESAGRLAARLERLEVRRLHRTSISDALLRASGLFRGNGFQGSRRAIDISGDGPNNQGAAVRRARDAVVRHGITINGLPILLTPGKRRTWYDLDNLDAYYEDCVIGGFGAFIVRVAGGEAFAAAIRRKLILEIASARPIVLAARDAQAAAPRVDCLIGEKLWDKWLEIDTP